MQPTTPSPRADSGAFARLWRLAVAWPVLSILVLVLAQHALTVGVKDLWFMDEARHGGVLRDLLENGDWLALSLNGTLYPDKPPVYFWYLAGIATLLGTTEPIVFYVGLAGTVFMMFWATHRMALRLTGERDVALAAVLILSSGFYFLGVTHYARMDMMFTAAIALSWMHFHLATTHMRAIGRRDMLAGFAWAAAAAMVKGPVGVMLPILALVSVLAWQRRPEALADRSVLGGLALAVAVIAAWAAGMVAVAGPEYFAHLFETQIVDRGLNKDGGWLGNFRYAVTLPVIFMPWAFLAFLTWRKRRVTPESQFLWIAAGSGALALSLVSEKHEYYLVPLLVPLSILAARGLLRLDGRRKRLFWTLAAATSAGLGAVFVAVGRLASAGGALPFDPGDYGAPLAEVWVPGLVLLGGAVAVWALRGRTRAALVVFALAQAMFITVTALRVFPGIDTVLSPRGVATAMAPHVATGHAPAIWHGEDGAFAYHLGARYVDAEGPFALLDWLERTPRAVAALPHALWWANADRFPDAGAVDCLRFAGQGIVIVTRPAPPRPVERAACALPGVRGQ